MDTIAKALAKLLPKEKDKIKNTLKRLDKGDFLGMDIVKLKGNNSIYRVRNGSMRIIFRKTDKTIKILTIERRSDTTYSL